VWDVISRPLLNSATLMLLTAIIGIGLGIAAGALAAVRRDGIFDHTLSSICLAVTALRSTSWR